MAHNGDAEKLPAMEKGGAMTEAETGQRLVMVEEEEAQGDAGAAFVLQGKGKWWHAGFHLTTAIVGPTLVSLPYAMAALGWAPGFVALTVAAAVTLYAYFLMSRVLDHCESQGRRHIRFRELAADVLGSGRMFYFVVSVQTVINMGVGIGCILLAAECLQILYDNVVSNGELKLYHFIAMVAGVMMILSQLPSFHSLRYINLASLLLSVTYSFCIVAACVMAGKSARAPPKDYSLKGKTGGIRMLNAFSALSILGTILGNGILPEIQATLAAPAQGKMLKALGMCYAVVAATFYSVAASGYWALGNAADANILKSLAPDSGPALAPQWLLGLAVACILVQLLAIALVYSQVAYDIMEKRAADARLGVMAWRNVLARVALRGAYVALCAVLAAMLPFFGDVNALVGSLGFIPLDFVLPMLLYNMALLPPRNSAVYCVNVAIMCVFSCVGALGVVASVRQIVLDAHRFHLFSGHAFD